jgi:ArsR family transcriptional regulator, arsenate/arsenite/antimonite-responsive transcriptional repressor
MDFSKILKAVSDRTRLRIMHLIDERGPELCVCDMMAALDLPQGTVSRQLMLLRHLGLVNDRREAVWMHYSLSKPADKERSAILRCLRECWKGNAEFQKDLERFDDLHARNAIVRCQGNNGKVKKAANLRGILRAKSSVRSA